PSHRVVASALLSRPPLILPPLSPLERSYYAYQRRIHRALAKPASVSQSWFFKKGTQAEKSFMKAFEMAAEEVEGAPDYVPRETEADKKGDVTSLERKADRTLYLLLKKNRKEHAWQFPQGGVEGEESLLEAAKRELHEETGVNVDVWPSGRVPAGAYTYPFPAEHKKKHPEHEGAKVFFMPMRIIRGQVEPNKQEGIVDFAWLTKEEVKEKVSPEYWEAVEPMLSDY
ncbi:NUDIX hydrolase domain-like protein, partial [Rhodotorula toruloides]